MRDAPSGLSSARSPLLYRHLLHDPDAPVSWQAGTTVAALAERVEMLPMDEGTEAALESLRNGTD